MPQARARGYIGGLICYIRNHVRHYGSPRPATDAALDEIAGASGRSKVQVAADLLASHAQHVAELHELVREAREDIAAGRVHSRDEVAASVQAIIDAAARKP